MSNSDNVRVEYLGQSGVRLDTSESTILIDPYLSHSVELLDSPDLVRQVPIPYDPSSLTSVNWVLITHDHMDHCDPLTLPLVADASPSSRFIGPLSVRTKLIDWNISVDRILSSPLTPFTLTEHLSVQAIPSAHPNLRFDQSGCPHSVGYLFRHQNTTLYIAGDTSIFDSLIYQLKELGPIDYAMLPVNEDNYFRRRRGIVGNMSVREAFELASEVGIKSVIPVHWDMFSVNSTSPVEIQAIYNSRNWPFMLRPCDPFLI